jgi:N-glycosylase/DNA lyase
MENNTSNWNEWSRYVLNEIKESRDEIRDILKQLKTLSETMVTNTNHLEEHMVRTENAEKSIHNLTERMTPIEKEIIEKTAIKKYRREIIVFILKVFGAVSTVGGAIWTIAQFF